MEDWEKEWMKDVIGSKMRYLESLFDEINLSKRCHLIRTHSLQSPRGHIKPRPNPPSESTRREISGFRKAVFE